MRERKILVVKMSKFIIMLDTTTVVELKIYGTQITVSVQLNRTKRVYLWKRI